MPSKAQATQLPTFGAFKKFETHMQSRLSTSTENSYHEEERDSGVFLKACDEPASQLNPDRDKILIFQKIIFSRKFRSAAARRASSHLGKLQKLRNLRKSIIRKFLASIHRVSFWCWRKRRTSHWVWESYQFGAGHAAVNWRWYAAPPETAVQYLDSAYGGIGERWRAIFSQFPYLAGKA